MNNLHDTNGVSIEGHIKIFDPQTEEIFVQKRNAINYENMSIALAESLGNTGQGFVSTLSLGNGGTSVDPTGIITYLTPNSTGQSASLYNETFNKIVDQNNVNNADPSRNKIEIKHLSGTNYTDIIVSCLLDFGEPAGQDAFDTASGSEKLFVFDELGLRSVSQAGEGRLITHVIFHPIQKSLNRLIEIDYTVRIQSLTGFNEV